MKKIFFLIFILFLIWNPIYSQDFEPGTQAQNYVESKNVTVDYSTGIFYYNIPLFEITSGRYSVPVTLEYTGRGVKYNAKPGFTGYNWSLNTGGIVTRTIRGGITDEYPSKGIANTYNTSKELWDDVTTVHKHDRDGEHDIFTAVFNGQSVDFIIVPTGSRNTFKVEPLERTNVKIDYHFETGKYQISGWTVTDEAGVQYIYEEPEWTTSIGKQEPGGVNSISNENYISSWHLTQIKAPGCTPIIYRYENPYIEKGNSTATREGYGVQYNESMKSMYIYGKPLKNYPFDFYKNSSDFNFAIEQAKSSLSQEKHSHIDNIINRSTGAWEYPFDLYSISSNQVLGFQTQYFLNNINIISNYVLGITSNLESTASVSQGTLDAINAAISALDDGNYLITISWLSIAKEYIVGALLEEMEINSKDVYNVTAYQIFPPLLRSISNGREEANFYYSLNSQEHGFKLDSIAFKDMDEEYLSSYHFLLSDYGLLKSFVKLGKDKKPCDKFRFDYHYEDIRPSYFTKDKWGDFTLNSFGKQDYDSTLKYNKRFSLASIENEKGGKIRFDYEPNRYYCVAPDLNIPIYEYEHFEWFAERYPSLEFVGDYSGIRLKELVLDAGNGQTDIVRYRYPDYGVLIHSGTKEFDRNEYSNPYDNFTDFILLSSTSYIGHTVKQGGNNGLFYNYIEEELVDKGTNTYLFSVPLPFHPNLPHASPFWYYGLPLASASYDINGNLVKLSKNHYYSDKYYYWLSQDIKIGNRIFDQAAWFTDAPESFKYNNYQQQVKANGYFVNKEEAIQQFSGQITIWFDEDRYSGITLNNRSLYVSNIEPRLNLEDQPLWNFSYGGKTVLKEQKEYMFTGNISNSPSINHLIGAVPSGNVLVSHIEYAYDNPTAHASPTRIINYQSNGSKQITQVRTPLDFKTGTEGILEAMKKANMVSIPVKEQVYTEYNGRTNLISEGINLYTQVEDGVIFPGSSFLYASSSSFTPSLIAEDNKLFTVERSLYKLSNQWEYRNYNKQWYPVSQLSLRDTFQFNYDTYNTNLPIFKATISENSCVKAVSPWIYQSYKVNLPAPTYQYDYEREYFEEDIIYIYEYFYRFLTIIEDFNPNLLQGHQFLTPAYLESEEFLFMKQYIKNTLNRVRVEILLEDLDKYGDNIIYVTDFHLLMDFMHFNVENFDYFQMIDALMRLYNILGYTPQYYELFPCHYAENLELLRVTKSALYNQYRVYCLVYPQEGNNTFSPQGRVIRNNNVLNTIHLPSFVLKPREWQIVTFDLDLSAYSSLDELDIRSVYSDVVISYAAIVPVGVEFEGTVYDYSRLPIFNLNQNGNLVRYNYDAGGRLTHVYDKDGNLLKEIEYSPFKD